MTLNQKISNKIKEHFNADVVDVKNLSGGCISNAYSLKLDNGQSLFLKVNENESDDMFPKEANGLRELSKPNVIRVPKVYLVEKGFIVLELIESGHKKKKFSEDFGIKFAKLHQYNSDKFGFFENNYIGSTPQINIPSEEAENNWVKFYFNNRILYQYKLAEKNGYATDELREGVSELENKIEGIISGSEEKPSLLHGDLWGGNYMVDENGNACLIDPAVYYGHREADLAMTKIFGGFSAEFYHAYNEYFPLTEGYEYRENLYKLYHILNHLNLFGRGYYSQAISLITYY